MGGETGGIEEGKWDEEGEQKEQRNREEYTEI